MDKLPVEILRRIFLASLPDRDTITYSTPLSVSVSSPLYISHVCRHWREISLSYGTLWSYLSLGFKDGLSRTRREAIVTVFNTWLERTNGCALNFAFSCKLYGGLSSKTASGIIQTLVSERFRWRDVYFEWKLFDPFRTIDLDEMPMLTSLYLEVELSSRPDFFTRVNLAKSSLLRTLKVEGITVLGLGEGSTFVSLERCHLGFGHVNGLRKTKTAVLACLDVLKAAANMTEFSYYLWGLDSLEPLGDGEYSCTARNIKSITLNSTNSAPFVLNKLTLPSLQCLRYHFSCRDSLLRFVQRSFPPLLALELSGAGTDEGTLVPALRLLPGLQELSLISPQISPWFFGELICGVDTFESTNDKLICPRLRSLHFDRIDFFGQDAEWYDALRAMVESRYKNLKTFKRVWVGEALFAIEIPNLRTAFMILASLSIPESRSREVWIDGDIEDPFLNVEMNHVSNDGYSGNRDGDGDEDEDE